MANENLISKRWGKASEQSVNVIKRREKKPRTFKGPQGSGARHHYTEQILEGEIGNLEKWSDGLY